jgi:transcription elongation factor Elf1
MATKTATAKGFAVRCLHCGEEETVRLDVHDLHTFHCSSCDAELSTDDVRAEMSRWAQLLTWIETAPEV